MIYIFLFLYSFILSLHFDFFNNKKGYYLNYYLLLIIIVCISGFRYRVGGDTLNYMHLYENIPTIYQLSNFNFASTSKGEPLWIIFCSISKTIGEDFAIFQFLHAGVVNFIFFYFFKKHTKYVFTSIFLYLLAFCFIYNWEIMREALAVCIFLISINFYLKKKWLHYYILSLIAYLFHSSSTILFILPFFYNYNPKILHLIILSAIGYIISPNLSTSLKNIALTANLSENIKNYSYYNYSFYGFISIVLLYIIYPYIVRFFFIKKIKQKNPLMPLLNIYILIGIFTTFFYIFFRFLNYLNPVLIIFLTETIHTIYKMHYFKKTRFTIISLIMIMFLSIHTTRFFSNTSKYVANTRWYSIWYPYYSIFNKKEDTTREMIIDEMNKTAVNNED